MTEFEELAARVDKLEQDIIRVYSDQRKEILDTVSRIDQINQTFSRHIGALVLMINILFALLVWYVITH